MTSSENSNKFCDVHAMSEETVFEDLLERWAQKAQQFYDERHGHLLSSMDKLREQVQRLADALPSNEILDMQQQVVRLKSEPDDGPKDASRRKSLQSFANKKKGKTASVFSLAEMESAVLQELVDIHPLSAATRMRTERSEAQSVGSESIVPRPSRTLHTSSARPGSPKSLPDNLPGLVGEDEIEERQNEFAGDSTKLRLMNQRSQTRILDGCADQETTNVDLDIGSKLINALPIFVYVLMGFMSACQISLAVSCGFLDCPIHEDWRLHLAMMPSILTALSAVLCLYFLRRALQSEDLNLAISRLHHFVADFKLQWSEVSGQERCKYVVAWATATATVVVTQCLTVLHVLDGQHGEFKALFYVEAVVSVCSFAISSGIIAAAAHAQSHLLHGLDKTLDCWCRQILTYPDFMVGVESWNAMQALLKCVGRELASSFLALQALGSIGLVLFLANGVVLLFQNEVPDALLLIEVLSSLPLLFLFLLSLRVSAHGAALTEKCRAIPPFVNQIPTSASIDQDRQYLVRFIQDSSAGFFVRDVKLTQEMFMKQVYIFGVLLSASLSILPRFLLRA
ncbi:unnamed protein product [Effrenium voratum]|nr:unnamed protein product [Effrenium voratum]